MEFEASFPAHGEALELVEQGEGLLDVVAELAKALDVRGAGDAVAAIRELLDSFGSGVDDDTAVLALNVPRATREKQS
jgi:hypothetical protein